MANPTNHTPKARHVALNAMADEKTGLVLIPLGHGRAAMAGNSITGEVFFSRVLFANDKGQLELPAETPVGWVIPNFQKEVDKVAVIVRHFLLYNTKLLTAHKPSPDITPQIVLEKATMGWLPRMANDDRSLGETAVAALESLTRVHTGQASPSETIIMLEMLITFLLALPESILGLKMDPASVQELVEAQAAAAGKQAETSDGADGAAEKQSETAQAEEGQPAG